MPPRAVVLLSGGLDSILAVHILQRQGIEVEALNFQTQFSCCGDVSAMAAARLGVRLNVIAQDDDYHDVIRKPRFGYVRGANPCVDCRVFMFQRARRFMEQASAAFVASGEILGQRPNSQGRRDLQRIEVHSGLEGRLLRPLSAKLLPPTVAEREGIVQRDLLYDFSGRSRKGLIQLARDFGLPDTDIPSPSTGCMLTEKNFAPRVFDLLTHTKDNTGWDFQLLKVGRHIRCDAQTKVVVGRREHENARIEYLARHDAARTNALLLPANFSGPAVLVVGAVTESTLELAGGLLARFTNYEGDHPLRVTIEQGGKQWEREIQSQSTAQAAGLL